MVNEDWGPPADLEAVPDAWWVGEEYEERMRYVQHLDGRMWAVVFGPAGVPRAMVWDDALMRRADAFYFAGPGRAMDRYMAGQGTKEDYQRAMVAVKAFWEREFHDYRVGSPL